MTRITDQALRTSVDHMKMVFDSVPYLMWFKDAEGRYVVVNKSFLSYFSITDPEYPVGKTDHEIWPNEPGNPFNFMEIESDPEAPPVVIDGKPDPTGRRSWFEVCRRPVFGTGGRFIGTVGYAHDVTSRVVAEMALEKLTEGAPATVPADPGADSAGIPETGQPENTMTEAPGDAALPGSLEGLRVLVTEDNKFNQLHLKTLLGKLGATAEIADHGKQAVEILQHKSFDLILMDLQMPEMDGITAATIIRRELGLKTPILAVTADVHDEITGRCNAAGIQGYVTKPFYLNELFDKITTALSQPLLTVRLADISRLSKMVSHDQKMTSLLIKKFISVTPAYVNDLKMASAKHDIIAIENQSHKLKGAIDAISTDIMRNLIVNINEIAKVGKFTPDKYVETPELYEMIDSFLYYFPELIRQLETEIPS